MRDAIVLTTFSAAAALRCIWFMPSPVWQSKARCCFLWLRIWDGLLSHTHTKIKTFVCKMQMFFVSSLVFASAHVTLPDHSGVQSLIAYFHQFHCLSLQHLSWIGWEVFAPHVFEKAAKYSPLLLPFTRKKMKSYIYFLFVSDSLGHSAKTIGWSFDNRINNV